MSVALHDSSLINLPVSSSSSSSPPLSSCASSVGHHNWSATQQHRHLQSAAWTSHQPALSTDRNRWCETPFVALHRHTGQSRPVAISSGRHCNDPAQCRNDSGETSDNEGGQNLVVGLWGQPLSWSWPPRPNSSLSSFYDMIWFKHTASLLQVCIVRLVVVRRRSVSCRPALAVLHTRFQTSSTRLTNCCVKTALCGRSITSITPDVLKVFTLALLIVSTPLLANMNYLLSPVHLSVVCLSVICNIHAPYSGRTNFTQYLYGIRYLDHPLTSTENFTEIVPGEPLRRGS